TLLPGPRPCLKRAVVVRAAAVAGARDGVAAADDLGSQVASVAGAQVGDAMPGAVAPWRIVLDPAERRRSREQLLDAGAGFVSEEGEVGKAVPGLGGVDAGEMHGFGPAVDRELVSLRARDPVQANRPARRPGAAPGHGLAVGARRGGGDAPDLGREEGARRHVDVVGVD